MKRKRKKRILPPIPLKLRPKNSLGQTKRMSQMQMSITVRIGKRSDELLVLFARGGVVGGVAFECFFSFPEGLDLEFCGTEGVAFGGPFGGSGCGGYG